MENFLITLSSIGPNRAQILFEGQLIIRNCNAIKRELILAINSTITLEIICRNIVKIDLAALQLFIALQKTAVNLGKNLSYEMQVSDKIRSVINNSGLGEILAAPLKSELNGIR